MAYKIGQDKKKHFFVGIPLGTVIQFILSYFFPVQPILATVINIVFLVAVCYGFELFSLVTSKGHADNLDAIAGILGGMLGIILFWGISCLL